MKFTNKEYKIRFINFMDNGKNKLCHANIDEETEDKIKIRTAAGLEQIVIKKANIISITKELPNHIRVSNEWIDRMYAGKILEKGSGKQNG